MGGLCSLDDDNERWIVPRYAICIFFWSGFILSFLGGMIIVNAYLTPDPPALTAGGGVLLAVGVILLVICLILTFHSYVVVMHMDENEGSKASSKDNRNGMTIVHHPEKQSFQSQDEYDFRRPPGTVTFNAVDTIMQVDGCNSRMTMEPSYTSRRQRADVVEVNHDGAITHKPPPFPRSEGRPVPPPRQPIRSMRKQRPASQPLNSDEIDLPTYGEVTIADSKVSLYDNVQYQWPNKQSCPS